PCLSYWYGFASSSQDVIAVRMFVQPTDNHRNGQDEEMGNPASTSITVIWNENPFLVGRMRERSGTIIGRAHICRNPPACDLTVRMSGCYGGADTLSFAQTNGTPAFSSFFADRPGFQAACSSRKHR